MLTIRKWRSKKTKTKVFVNHSFMTEKSVKQKQKNTSRRQSEYEKDVTRITKGMLNDDFINLIPNTQCLLI